MKLKSFDFSNEVWLPVTLAPYSIYYQVSDQGRVKSIHNTEFILKPFKGKRGGYMVVTLKVKGQRKTARINRLVALAHIPNPANLPEVNHENGDKEDNRKCNLKWCNKSYNNKHAYATGLNKGNKGSTSKPVVATDLAGNNIVEFTSVREAARKLNMHCQNICAVLKGKYKQSNGYHFSYK